MSRWLISVAVATFGCLSAAQTATHGGTSSSEPSGQQHATRNVEPIERCEFDAGTMVHVLENRGCRTDDECMPFRPRISGTALKCCYATRRDVLDDPNLGREWGLARDKCGHARFLCAYPCTAARCVEGLCRLVTADGGVDLVR